MCKIYYEGRWYGEKEVEENIMEYRAKISGLGIQPEEVTGLYLKRDAQMLFLIFALYDMGIAFLPLDIHVPKQRNDSIIRQAEVTRVLADTACDLDAEVVRVELLEHRTEEHITDSPVAYCIATSGTTGTPKIVQTGRRAFEFWMQDYAEFLKLKGAGSILCMSEYMFDMFMIESLFARRYGMTILLAGDGETGNAVRLMKLIRKEKPVYIQATPSRMKMLGMVDREYRCLSETEQVWLGGERIGEELLERLQKTGKRIINIYGPTETTVCCMTADVTSGSERLGAALGHSRIYLLDDQGNEAEAGEICVAGDCLFDGYRGDKVRTDERFTMHHGEPVYHTGDLAVRQGEDLVYRGRKDGQVKLRGYRVELEEIENYLSHVAGVKDICAAVGEKEELCVWYTAEERLENEVFIRAAGKSLPDYMIPYKYIQVESIPMTANGKRDRKALTGLKAVMAGKADGQGTGEGADKSMEERILKLVREKLEREDITAESKLDEAGVDSLMYVELLVDIEDMFGMEFEDEKVSYKEMNCVRDIAEYVKSRI